MAFLAVPGPFDFALTTSRFRAYGVDRTNLWHEGGLHHAVGGREIRIEAAPGGVEVEPLDAETEPVVRTLLGLAFDLEPFYGWAAADEVLAAATHKFRGFHPALAPDPFEMLVGAITSQQVSLFAALAIRNSRPLTTRCSPPSCQTFARSTPKTRKRSVESAKSNGPGTARNAMPGP